MNIILSKENPNRAFRGILESFYFYLKGENVIIIKKLLKKNSSVGGPNRY